MSQQTRVLITYAVLVVIIVAIFIVVALASRKPQTYDTVMRRGYALRRVWFWVLVVAAVASFAITIPALPYAPKEGYAEAVRIPVIARQYSFSNLPEVIPLDTPVVFEVTATDVNHGFAIYSPDDELIGQVQAMPLYTNELQVTFTRPGTYTVLCLEYCGISHHTMRSSFEVR